MVLFEIIEEIGQQACKLSLLENWKIHSVFHGALLKDWKTTSLQQDQPAQADDEPEVDKPYY